ncbi:MAG TPA: SIS domain-containing protein [Deltaproteobacteria bacterium]|nr:SIS domain-containing protein [Deltaproteobacteria bacterium]
MCGIVGYFGGAGNNLTRVHTAMSAMAYRAPDSTGVGIFGDDDEAIRVRRSVGSVTRLIERLLTHGLYPDAMDSVLFILESNPEKINLGQYQHRILSFEELPRDINASASKDGNRYPSFDDLVDLNEPEPVRLVAGWAGRPEPLPIHTIRSRKDLKKLIDFFTQEYDLSSLVIQTIIRHALEKTLLEKRKGGQLEIEPSDILNAFDHLFETTISEDRVSKPMRIDYGWAQRNPYAEKYLWRYLIQSTIRIPSDYDRDGVRCLFRLLDAAVLCRLPSQIELAYNLQSLLETQWPGIRNRPHLNWRRLYRLEKAANIYGRAAAAALSYLQLEDYLVEVKQSASQKDSVTKDLIPGQSDPVSLRFLSSPILSHGRWALQSPVSIENAHPFFDASKQRIVVLNGQFNGEIEDDIRRYLNQACGYSFRSGNSSEYLAVLWGHYFEHLAGERRRYQTLLDQVKTELEEYSIGSQSIDYQVYQQVKDKTIVDLDALAFVEAVRRIVRNGGQIAVTGMSIQSPRQLYVASHNRPVFVVRRLENDDFMVVSDIHAALGLFPQSLILEKTRQLRTLKRGHSAQLARMKSANENRGVIKATIREYEEKEREVLQAFQVAVHPLDGEEIFARIGVAFEEGELCRQVVITDFDGNPLPDIEPYLTILRPTQANKDFYDSFYKAHLSEIPERMNHILQNYIPEGETTPRFDIREKFLVRRFGRRLGEIERIVLTGMGSAYAMGRQAKAFMQSLFPDVDVLVLQPVEIDDVRRTLVPENDLVILLSWSATTGDMVQFAKTLLRQNIAMIGITEKIYADMALLAQKSGGVIPICSGEEVTVSGVKSTVCMLFVLYLFAVWLCTKRYEDPDVQSTMNTIQQIPDLISQVLDNEVIDAFSETLARDSKESRLCVTIGDRITCGIGREAAWKLEENSWLAMGKTIDYRELDVRSIKQDIDRCLVIVNATRHSRFHEALAAMKRLSDEMLPFAAVSFMNREIKEIGAYSQTRYVLLPKTDDLYQPFIDLAFYYKLAYHYGKSHGRSAGEFPRNRVKSVTAALSPPQKLMSPSGELHKLGTRDRLISDSFGSSHARPSESLWEQDARAEEENIYYRQIRSLMDTLMAESPLDSLLITESNRIRQLSTLLYKDLPDSGEVIFIPMDRTAESAARNVAVQWLRFLSCNVRVSTDGAHYGGFSDESLAIFVASKPPDIDLLSAGSRRWNQRLWVGPVLPKEVSESFKSSLGCFEFTENFSSCRGDSIYAGLCCLFIEAWKKVEQKKADIYEHHIRKNIPIVSQVLNSQALKQAVSECMADNRSYETALFTGPLPGIGLSWITRFEQTGSLSLAWHPFGESAHGPLVTVDPLVDRKFIRLDRRDGMILDYGESQIAKWERRYLKGQSIDAFLDRSRSTGLIQADSPFFAEGGWYLPELRTDYDTAQDNLVIIDATSNRHFSQALDELATFGCRYARIIVVSQEAFRDDGDKKALYSYPVSHWLMLPAILGQDGQLPVSTFFLPLVMNILAMAMAYDSIS